mgnify:CR=1 FL=1
MEKPITQAQPRTARAARAWIAIGFAVVAIAAVASNARAFAGGAEQSASGALIALPAQFAEPSDQVDWSKVAFASITPAESVAAYDR